VRVWAGLLGSWSGGWLGGGGGACCGLVMAGGAARCVGGGGVGGAGGRPHPPFPVYPKGQSAQPPTTRRTRQQTQSIGWVEMPLSTIITNPRGISKRGTATAEEGPGGRKSIRERPGETAGGERRQRKSVAKGFGPMRPGRRRNGVTQVPRRARRAATDTGNGRRNGRRGRRSMARRCGNRGKGSRRRAGQVDQ